MCDQQSLRSACGYAQSDQEAAEARPSLHMSKCHIVGNLMHWLKVFTLQERIQRGQQLAYSLGLPSNFAGGLIVNRFTPYYRSTSTRGHEAYRLAVGYMAYRQRLREISNSEGLSVQ